uniref:Metal ion binding protein n=1 Tax=Trifolium repens TaxID=3899 RepID=D3YBF1_TRIRP|nr:metal ion binding protein [Trifolium repens]
MFHRPSSNVKRAFLVDTLQLVRNLESNGFPSKQAEAITSAITEVLNDSLENVAQSFVSKSDMQKSEMIQETNLSKFKSEVQSSQRIECGVVFNCFNSFELRVKGVAGPELKPSGEVEHHFSLLQRETEKLRNDIDKMRSELRYEIDKVTAGQRLDLNLERGRIKDELADQNAETTNLTNKLDREIHALRAQLEAAKYDVIKYCIGNVRMNYSQLSSLHVECIFYKHGLLSELLRPAFEIFANPRCQAAGDLKGSLP